MSSHGYRFLDRLLHRLALQFASIAEMSFDFDQRVVGSDPAEITSQRHVFVSGLARAGTTVLMRRFYATGLYRSLTYRDMPFVLAPNLWQRLSSISRREIGSAERAHGDNLLVDANSPESLDEVFWRVFAGDEYLEEGCLKVHAPDENVIQKYVCYINAILSGTLPQRKRYLSKNNNNILRLGAIHQAFPNALILIPFREPLQQAQSLLRQHCRFIEMQSKDEFTLSYMTWLGHHEFGLDHRPFQLGSAVSNPYSIDTLDYWLQLWTETYAWLEISRPTSAVFVCYEDLCSHEETWARVAKLAGISVGLKTGEPFRLPNRPLDTDADPELAARARYVYERLLAQARLQLS